MDAQKALWPASFGGLPCYAEHDDERGGRRIVPHIFPHRDDPFLEDMGRIAKSFEVTLYFAGDSSAASATSLSAVFDTAGAKMLVLPTHGSILVRNGPFSRSRSKDRIGYIAFTATFWREGAASSLVSLNFLAQLAFDAVGNLASAAQSLTGLLRIVGAAEWVVASAVGAVQNGVAMLEVIRDSSAVDPLQAAPLALAISNVYAEVPTSLTRLAADPAFIGDYFDAARALSAAMAPATAAAAFAAELDSFPVAVAPAGVSVNSALAASNGTVANALIRLVLIAGQADALINQTYADRPAALAARAALNAALDVEVEAAADMQAADVFTALVDLRSAMARFFSTTVADLKPVVIVTAPRQLPAIWHAWRLYADPTRAQELIDRSRAPHPAFLSTRFEALAP